MKYSILIVLFLIVSSVFGQEKILIINGMLHVGNGETQPSALIGIEKGEITIIKNALAYTYDPLEWDTIIDVKGQHIYPGFVAPNSTLGITEIDAVRATRDFDDVGEFNPHVRSQIAFNTESKVLATVRANGVLIVQPTPKGGRISGTSAIMRMDGWNWEDATISENDGIHLNWPSSIERGGWWAEPGELKRNEDYESQKMEIYSFFELAKAHAKMDDQNSDIRLAAMTPCFQGKKRVYIHADELQQITDVIRFVQDFDIKYPVIIGGYDSYLLAPQLKDAKIPVMIQRPHSLPKKEDDDVDQCYKLASLLQQGGVKFCIQNSGSMEAMNTRNLPFLAGTAMAYGLTEEQAVRSISLSSCEIMGIDKKYGSIEVGKSATLIVSEGNALDMRTNNITMALIDGKEVDLNDHQKELYEKYSRKYDEQKNQE